MFRGDDDQSKPSSELAKRANTRAGREREYKRKTSEAVTGTATEMAPEVVVYTRKRHRSCAVTSAEETDEDTRRDLAAKIRRVSAEGPLLILHRGAEVEGGEETSCAEDNDEPEVAVGSSPGLMRHTEKPLKMSNCSPIQFVDRSESAGHGKGSKETKNVPARTSETATEPQQVDVLRRHGSSENGVIMRAQEYGRSKRRLVIRKRVDDTGMQWDWPSLRGKQENREVAARRHRGQISARALSKPSQKRGNRTQDSRKLEWDSQWSPASDGNNGVVDESGGDEKQGQGTQREDQVVDPKSVEGNLIDDVIGRGRTTEVRNFRTYFSSFSEGAPAATAEAEEKLQGKARTALSFPLFIDSGASSPQVGQLDRTSPALSGVVQKRIDTNARELGGGGCRGADGGWRHQRPYTVTLTNAEILRDLLAAGWEKPKGRRKSRRGRRAKKARLPSQGSMGLCRNLFREDLSKRYDAESIPFPV